MSGTEGRANRMSEYIEREKAIEYFMINTNWRDEDGCLIDDWDEKRKLLEDYFNGVPSADVRPVVPGEWIPVTGVDRASKIFPYAERVWVDATEPDEIDAVKCSVCGEVFDFADARNWCTECGAKMDRKGADDEA